MGINAAGCQATVIILRFDVSPSPVEVPAVDLSYVIEVGLS